MPLTTEQMAEYQRGRRRKLAIEAAHVAGAHTEPDLDCPACESDFQADLEKQAAPPAQDLIHRPRTMKPRADQPGLPTMLPDPPYEKGHVHSFKRTDAETLACRECPVQVRHRLPNMETGFRGDPYPNIYTDGFDDWPKLIAAMTTGQQSEMIEKLPRTKGR
jgi:hypothetical protein